jgi:hypothetical protein
MIQQHTAKLSPELQKQVLNFVLFLKQKHEKQLLAEQQQRKDSDKTHASLP